MGFWYSPNMKTKLLKRKEAVEAALKITHPDERNAKLVELGFVTLASVRLFLAQFSEIPFAK